MSFENRRRRTQNHGFERRDESGVGAACGMQHRRQPRVAERLHAVFAREIDENLPLLGFACDGSAHARIEQAQPLDTFRRIAQHLQRDATAHGEAADRKARRRFVEHMGRHGVERVEAEEVERAHVKVAAERRDLCALNVEASQSRPGNR